jgi:hypothetical protein
MDDINQRIFLLKMLTRERDETMRDVIISLSNTGMFTPKEGKRIRRKLEKEGYVRDGELTLKGMAVAKKTQNEFRLL